MRPNWISVTDWPRLLRLSIAVAVSCIVGYRFQPLVANNPNAVNTVVTIFSILAGFLIAVITFIAEPTLKQAKTWSELQKMKETVRRKLFRQNIIFFLYLITLGIALIMYLTPPNKVYILEYLQMTFLGLATFVFLASFSLPGSLMKIQMERYEAALESTRPQVISDAKDAAQKAKTQK
ncbi:hypothetical protein [Stappia sp. WLB 29]|uniref:hypothetical protein n=1 Tax=Stappia sp. WLB 29 TaxID=2925220 RepID=UPI0020BE2E6A|nr:hypothetical protein [Stappia sp. WLB 29]